MRNLIPEARADKNGNIVTRWIRSMNKKRSNTPIPSPAITEEPNGSDHNEQAVIELFALLHPTKDYDPDARVANHIRIVAEQDPELLRRITQAARDSTVEREHWLDRFHLYNKLTRDNPEHLATELNTFRIALPVNAMLHTLGHNCTFPISDDPPYLLYPEVVALIMKDGNITNPSEDLTKAITLIAYIKGLQVFKSGSPADGNSTTYNSISADADYITDHIEQVMELLPELLTRKTHDRQTIELLLNNDSQALREGEL